MQDGIKRVHYNTMLDEVKYIAVRDSWQRNKHMRQSPFQLPSQLNHTIL